MRDVVFQPLSETESLVISADNSGGVGEKEHDLVHVPYETVAYFGLRVALMELLAVGAEPVSVVIQNFNDEAVWERLEAGVQKVFHEAGIGSVPVSGSTESNFRLLQSATGFICIGKINTKNIRIGVTPEHAKLAVIGKPLVGEEVLTEQEHVAPLSLFYKLLHTKGVYEIVPVGSKGIEHELKGLALANRREVDLPAKGTLDLKKSAGPSTCFIMSYSPEIETELKKICSHYFYEV